MNYSSNYLFLVSSMSFGREDPDMKIVHQQMKQYLKLEEEAMEERIRYVDKEPPIQQVLGSLF